MTKTTQSEILRLVRFLSFETGERFEPILPARGLNQTFHQQYEQPVARPAPHQAGISRARARLRNEAGQAT
ncbi:MAG: hypothetical protein H0V18_14630 [Pyrinomonadaceae bacterium]|nr:hypothetical protein [Pyrinomonadaceae bacterium]